MRRAGPAFVAAIVAVLVAACGTVGTASKHSGGGTAVAARRSPEGDAKAREVVLAALALLDTGYRFGGKNPEAGLDCSGMVTHVFASALGERFNGSAVDMAQRGHRVDRAALQPGDLVFFDTLGRPRSHVGIYVGDGRFIHAPSSKGKVRIESLERGWFAERFEEARRVFD